MRITRDGTKVVVTLEGHSGSEGRFTMTAENDHGAVMYAGLVVDALRKELANRIEVTRRAEYERGWKDAKSRKVPKCDWFRRVLEDAP